jgi:uncharacterized membrane protein
MARKLGRIRQWTATGRNGKRPSAGPTARSLEDRTEQNIETIGGLEAADDALRTATDRTADQITRFAGSMWFV